MFANVKDYAVFFRAGFILLLFLGIVFTANSIHAQYVEDEDNRVITEWVDDTPPLSYEEWRTRVGEPGKFVVKNIGQLSIKPGDLLGGEFVIIVAESLFADIQTSLTQYAIDVANDGFTVATFTMDGGEPEDLRLFLNDRYVEGMVGCVLIGDLPVYWFEAESSNNPRSIANFPCDLFLMDLNGVWEDTSGNGIDDSHTGDVGPEIWLGRLYASTLTYEDADEVELIQNYFTKNHLYRTGQVSLNDRAFCLIDDDWSHWHNNLTNDLKLVYDDVTTIYDHDATSDTTYENNLSENYELVHVCAHSSATSHRFTTSWGFNWTYHYEVIDIDPEAYFYNLFACSNGRYVSTDYMAGWYIFCDTYGQAAIASTKTGAMLRDEYFYAPFGCSMVIGESFMRWFDKIAENGFTGTEMWWHYGMYVCGDPTLIHFSDTPALDDIWVDANYGDDNLGDGTCASPFRTIGRGIEEAVDNDTVMVRPGFYRHTGNVDLNYYGKNIVVMSLAGPEETLINCENLYQGITFGNREGRNAKFIGFTVSDAIRGIDVYDCSPTIENCIFNNCSVSGLDGGAVSITGNIAYPYFKNCTFENNTAISDNSGPGHQILVGGYGGAVAIQKGAEPLFVDCIFQNNSADIGGGAIASFGVPRKVVTFRYCLFLDNHAGHLTYGGKGGAFFIDGEITLYDNTIVKNSAYQGGALYCKGNADMTYARNILAYTNEGDGIYTEDGAWMSVQCCDFWENSRSHISGAHDTTVVDENTIFLNPLFCDMENDDYTISSYSPCDEDSSLCGALIGKYDDACDYCCWLAGDVRNDGSVDTNDVVYLTNYIFHGGRPPICLNSGDVNADCSINIDDVNYLINYLYEGGEVPVCGCVNDWGNHGKTKTAEILPSEFRLYQNYPNPFNPTTTISYDLPFASNVMLKIYNLMGQHVTTLVDDYQDVGHHQVRWNGADGKGNPVVSGIYFYIIKTDVFEKSKKMLLIK